MKRLRCFAAVLFIAVTAFIISGCSDGAADAQAAFENIMTALQSCDKSEIDEYYSFAELAAFVDEAAGAELESAVISTLSKMRYRVNSAEKTENGAVALSVEITTVDFSAVMKDYINNVINLVDSKEYKARVSSMTDESYRKLMAEQMISALNRCGDTTTSQTIVVTMTKSGDTWKLGGASDEFLGALFANMSEAVAALI